MRAQLPVNFRCTPVPKPQLPCSIAARHELPVGREARLYSIASEDGSTERLFVFLGETAVGVPHGDDIVHRSPNPMLTARVQRGSWHGVHARFANIFNWHRNAIVPDQHFFIVTCGNLKR